MNYEIDDKSTTKIITYDSILSQEVIYTYVSPYNKTKKRKTLGERWLIHEKVWVDSYNSHYSDKRFISRYEIINLLGERDYGEILTESEFLILQMKFL